LAQEIPFVPNLTKRFVEGLKPSDCDIYAWDRKLAGFGLRVKPSGVRSYFVQYRTLHGRSRRLTIGRHGALTVDEARKEARGLLAATSHGEDPAGARAGARKAPSVSQLCDRYLAEHVVIHNRPSTAKEFARLIDRHVRPELGKQKAHAVTRQDIVKLHHRLKDTPRQANHVLSVLSKMFSLAELWGLRPENSNPCRRIKRYDEAKRERFLSEAELKRLGGVLNQAEANQTALLGVINGLRLLALTGCRLSEILRLEWDHVDFEAGVLALPGAKTGTRLHSVGAPALAILASIPRIEGSPRVLHGPISSEPLSTNTIEGAWRRIRKAAGLQDVRIHDLRHTVGTYAGQTGANAFLIRDKLGHRTLAMTGRYVSRDPDPLRSLSNQVENRIASAMRGEISDNVIRLRPPREG
jgi:integrase